MKKISLAAARVNANLTQKQVAIKMNIDKTTLSNWERGKTAPKATQLIKLCKIYDISIDDVFFATKVRLKRTKQHRR